MCDGFIPLLGLPRQLTEHIFRAGIVRIDFQFGIELSFGIRRSRGGWRLRKYDSSNAIVNTSYLGILLQDLAIFRFRLVPFALHLKRLGIELLRLIRGGRYRRELLGSARGQVRISVDRDV